MVPSPDICIYHAACIDGFTAAWAVWKKFGDGVTFIPAQYGDAPPDVTGKHVVIVDFSYPRPVLERMAASCASLLVLDHHKSAQQELAFLPKPRESWVGHINDRTAAALFDMDRSGAGLTWDYFHMPKQAPRLVQFVQDRDLWRFKLIGTREIHACIASHSMNFKNWSWLSARCDFSMSCEEMIGEGSGILRASMKAMRELIAATRREMTIQGYRIPVANVPFSMASEAGNVLDVGVPFSATYCDTAKGRAFSLRSAPDGIDVSEIAKKYGGGGHVHAAGFSAPLGWEGD